MTNYNERLDKILHTAKVNWKTSPDEIFDKGVTAYAKQAIQSHIDKAVRERLPHIQEFYEWCTEEGIDEEAMYKVAGWLGSEIYMPNVVAQLTQSDKEQL